MLWSLLIALFLVDVSYASRVCELGCKNTDGFYVIFHEPKKIICNRYWSEDMSLSYRYCPSVTEPLNERLCVCGSSHERCGSYCYNPSECAYCWCNEPRDCDWYSECLHAQYPNCSGSDNYALNYGQVYCEKYRKNLYLFSSHGQRWVASAKKCLQTGLFEYLEFGKKASCVDLKQAAIQSHVKCYTDPERNQSVCNLSCRDMAAIFWTIKGAYADNTTRGMVAGQVWEGAKICIRRFQGCVRQAAFFTLRMTIKLARFVLLGKRSVECDDNCLANGLAESLFDQIQMPSDDSMYWLAFSERTEDGLAVDILLSADPSPERKSNTTGIELVAVTDQLISLVKTQHVINVDGKDFDVIGSSVCENRTCEETTTIYETSTTKFDETTTIHETSTRQPEETTIRPVHETSTKKSEETTTMHETATRKSEETTITPFHENHNRKPDETTIMSVHDSDTTPSTGFNLRANHILLVIASAVVTKYLLY